ncbi:MAG: hypothetical protein WCE75_11610 [Terracidiphilus sp.]
MKSLLTRGVLLALILVSVAAAAAPAPKSRIEIKDGWYWIDGHKFLVNAIGYEPGARPGEDPYKQRVSNLPQIRQDLANIKAAGFNGIRTWSSLTEDELKLVQQSGLKIVFGVSINPEEDFSDPKVVERDLEATRQTLAYTRKYDCVITYLIMNEPMPAHIRKVGAQATLDLWTKLRDLIHAEDPGVPVTISGNTAITGWLDLNLFDVYGHNTYDYTHEGSNFTHTYTNTNRFVAELNGGGKPVVVTEFGRSVSRSGAGAGEYGGNTLEEQARAMVAAYRALLDSGATGLCPFYYADGWWKGGEPAVHNDAAEEWFGFWGFKDLNDKIGYPRPAWHALANYNLALVTSPKNHQFYQNEVPVEAFVQPEVKRFRVVTGDAVLWEAAPDARGYVAGKLSFAGEELKDRELVFESYDARSRLIKQESVVVLTGKDPVDWPTLELRTPATDLGQSLAQSKDLRVEYRLTNPGVFALGGQLRAIFAPHKGWEPGEQRVQPIDPALKQQTVAMSYTVPDECFVLGLYAGADIRYGKFTRTVYAQKFLFRGNWADPIRLK